VTVEPLLLVLGSLLPEQQMTPSAMIQADDLIGGLNFGTS
jgi:hypothetical protein